jgi:drug/metabolite transporter (DMT)-like permease
MPRDNRVSVRLVVGLALAILLDTIQQLVWKEGMGDIPDTASPWETIAAALHEPLLGLVAILMLVRLINWLKVLELADLSYAQPITSLSYVTVTLLSVVYLKETLTLLQVAGIVVVLAGVWCISQTERDSHESEHPSEAPAP